MIKEKRIERHYTQEQMANLLNISLRQYIRIDKQEDMPRKDIMKNLFQTLEMTDEEIAIYIKEIINLD